MLTADRTFILNGVTVREYLLTKHNPNRISMPTINLPDKIAGITVHNTEDLDNVNDDAEQYTRATVNGNMGTVRVHYYVDDVCAWQNLPLTLSGWHAADGGNGPGNTTTISIECIMDSSSNSQSLKAEDNCARLVAYLLDKYGLTIEEGLFTHLHWINVRNGRRGSNEYLNTTKYSGEKYCPYYILPHWSSFKNKVQKYLNELKGSSATEDKNDSKDDTSKNIYRIRKSWTDASSQIGAYENLDNAKKSCKEGYSVYDNNGNEVYSNKPKTESSTSITLGAGDTVKLSNDTIYASASATNGSKKTGTFYVYSNEVINGRIRITNSKSNVGKTPAGTYVTGFVNVSDVTNTTDNSPAPAKSYAKGTKITLNNVTLYANSSTKTGRKISGTYWIYDGINVSGRMRITNAKSNVGKTPIGRYVTGFIKKSDI